MSINVYDKNLPLVSIIVPVYGTEKTLSKCLESILSSTYKNLEVIVVNDKSPGNASEIIRTYEEIDSRVKLIEHEKNKGLFLARMTGVNASHGKYIGFLDSDERVSIDFYRRLVEKAETTDSDMVMGDVLLDYESHFAYYNFAISRICDLDVRGDEVADLLFNQRGKDWSLHVVWNKLYRRDLWNKCESYFEMQKEHLIMCEDILYSTFLFYFSEHFSNIHGDFVYYTQSDSNSTQVKNKTVKTFKKNIMDIRHVFSIINNAFKNYIHDERYIEDIYAWLGVLKANYIDMVKHSNLNVWEKKKVLKFIYSDDVIASTGKEWGIFSSVITSQKEIFSEKVKQIIADSSVKVISFDIFDTLVVRPFWEPTDLFDFLGVYANKFLKSADLLDFKDLRITAEQQAREMEKVMHPDWEEITLDDIYEIIQNYLKITDEERDAIKEKEIDLEYKYCYPREYAKELFNLCLALNKKVVITSDMYLSKEVIERILRNCGYTGYDKVYLSSEVKVGKWSGNLFKYLCHDLGIRPKEILHIGDTMQSDVDMAKKNGPTIDVFP